MREAVSIESICLPEQILKNLETYFGEPGLRWAAHFPAQLSKVLEEWQLTIGDVFSTDPRVDVLSFTGSAAVGKHLSAQAAATVKKVDLELGGNAPFIVFVWVK